MRRTVFLGIATAILLAMAAGSIAAALLMPAGPVANLPATGSAETVRRFYAAANDVIATGDPAPIRKVVAPHFVDVDPLPGVGPGGAGLEAYLAALHLTDPGMRLEVEEIVAAGDRVVARVGVRSAPNAAALGGSVVDQSPPWGAVESFRVAGGRIVERRSDTDELAVVRPLAESTVTIAAPASRMITVKRVTLARGARWDALPTGPRVLFLEAGTLRLEPTAPQGAEPRAATLSAGGVFQVAALGRLGAMNLGADAARVLVVTFAVSPLPGQAVPETEPLPAGVSVRTLAGGPAAELNLGPATVSLGRATLAPDGRLSLSSAAGPVLLMMGEGEADMAAWGASWTRRVVDGTSSLTREATLAAGDGLFLPRGGLATLHGGGAEAAEALIVTVLQAPATPPASPAWSP